MVYLEAAVLPAPLEHDIAPLWHDIAPIRSVPSNLAKCTRPSSEGLPAIRKTRFLERKRGFGDETNVQLEGDWLVTAEDLLSVMLMSSLSLCSSTRAPMASLPGSLVTRLSAGQSGRNCKLLA